MLWRWDHTNIINPVLQLSLCLLFFLFLSLTPWNSLVVISGRFQKCLINKLVHVLALFPSASWCCLWLSCHNTYKNQLSILSLLLRPIIVQPLLFLCPCRGTNDSWIRDGNPVCGGLQASKYVPCGSRNKMYFPTLCPSSKMTRMKVVILLHPFISEHIPFLPSITYNH